MRVMILAAGRGERMRPLTDHTPKPLLSVGGKPLIAWHLERLAAAGLREVVINHAWLGQQLESALGDGSRWGLNIHWSPEPPGGLETAGGIARALPLLGDAPFLVINGDVWIDWDPAAAPALVQTVQTPDTPAWLLLVDNPTHHPEGDFWLDENTHRVHADPPASLVPRLTFSGVGIYHPRLFAQVDPAEKTPLAPLLRTAMREHRVLGARHDGTWIDVGTPERLHQLDQALRARQYSSHPPVTESK